MNMTVGGHFEQMHESRCYPQTETMSCTTCHNPHSPPESAHRVEYFRQICLSCHQADGGCQLAEQPRLKRSPQNDCVACHMPRTETDIPHFSFTHHRIGLQHVTEPEDDDAARRHLIRLKPFGDVSDVAERDLERALGIAYVHFSRRVGGPYREEYLQRGLDLLLRVDAANVRDADVLEGLAHVYWNQESRECLPLAAAALESPDCSPETRIHALIVLGDAHFQIGNLAAARDTFAEMTTLRRFDSDWQMLGICLAQENDQEGAIQAFRKAVAIRPDRAELHDLLSAAYDRAGQTDLAEKHRRLSMMLSALPRSASSDLTPE